jgi:hypothetical protein
MRRSVGKRLSVLDIRCGSQPVGTPVSCGREDQSLASHWPVTGSPHDPSMLDGPPIGGERATHRDGAGRPPLRVSPAVSSLWPSPSWTVPDGLDGRKVTLPSRCGAMFITDPERALTGRSVGRKSHHADAHTWRRVFSAARGRPTPAAVAEESMHGTADRLPAARTWVWSPERHAPAPPPTEALCLGGQEGARRTWC